MSVIFGVRNAGQNNVSSGYLQTLGMRTLAWARDGTAVRVDAQVGMGCQPYQTHDRLRLDAGPACDEMGNMITLDGRLDNHHELRTELDIANPGASDAEIMLAAFRRWQNQCFRRFIGDWAVAIWSGQERSLYLARDHAGTRPLYFENTDGNLRWSSCLETFFQKGEAKPADETYLASFLLGMSLGDRTPYAPIRSVSPAQFIVFREDGTSTKEAHWRCFPDKNIRYRDDTEYEEHFLELLKRSIARRTVAGAPILAQLSGGMDSTTIVCVSDLLRSQDGRPKPELLDTVSFYDDSEPTWNERPYFTEVEASRGKLGMHVDLSTHKPSFDAPSLVSGRGPLLPGLDAGVQAQNARMEDLIAGGNYRVVLSGLGGDELLGGVPSPLPELSDHLFKAHLPRLIGRAIDWSLAVRKPLVRLLWDTMAFSWAAFCGVPDSSKKGSPWITPKTLHTFRAGTKEQTRLSRPHSYLPSVLSTADTWQSLLTTLPNPELQFGERREFRFPYLDRDLVEFLIAIPSDQLVRPGRRRSLMRRAVKGIVPELVLERKRKAFVSRAPALLFAESTGKIRALMSGSRLVREGYLHHDALTAVLDAVAQGSDSPWRAPMLRACLLEIWLTSEPPLSFPS